MLADYGAQVLKVERPGVGDDTRTWGPPWWGDGEQRVAAYFLCANRGKRSVAVDIATAEGAAYVAALHGDGALSQGLLSRSLDHRAVLGRVPRPVRRGPESYPG